VPVLLRMGESDRLVEIGDLFQKWVEGGDAGDARGLLITWRLRASPTTRGPLLIKAKNCGEICGGRKIFCAMGATVPEQGSGTRFARFIAKAELKCTRLW